MKAIYFERHGEIAVLQYGDIPTPVPAPGEALIKVRAVALNHLDIWVRRGWPGLKLPMPHVGGSDIVGEVISLNGSSTLKVGERVFINPGMALADDPWVIRGEESVSPSYKIIGEDRAGGLAEFVTAPLSCVIPAPADLSDETLAARILVGTTCWRMLIKRGGLQKDESVLVVGSGGGVNSLSISLAHAMGAHVIALAGSRERCQRASELGAQQTICYRDNPNWAKEIIQMTGGNGVDLVIDNVGQATFPQSLRALKRGGRLVTVGNTSGFKIELDNRLIFGKQLSIIGSTMGSAEDLKDALFFMRSHNIGPVIDCVDTLENGIAQIARIERGEHFGKIVLKVP